MFVKIPPIVAEPKGVSIPGPGQVGAPLGQLTALPRPGRRLHHQAIRLWLRIIVYPIILIVRFLVWVKIIKIKFREHNWMSPVVPPKEEIRQTANIINTSEDVVETVFVALLPIHQETSSPWIKLPNK